MAYASAAPTMGAAAGCGTRHGWIEAHVRERFGHFEARAARLEPHRLNQTLFLHRSRSRAPKGKPQRLQVAELAIGYDASGAPYAHVVTLYGGGGQGKLEGMRAILIDALSSRLAGAALRPLFSRFHLPVPLFFNLYDFPIVQNREKPRTAFPLFAMCSSANAYDVAVPDFTFHHYPGKLHHVGANTSWARLAPAIAARARELPWRTRRPVLFWRGCVRGSRIRSRLVPLLQRLGRDDVSVPIDAHDSGYFGRSRDYVPVDRQCDARFLLHLDGNAYSASLKYKLACGSVVVVVGSPFHEWWYAGLREGVHYVRVDGPNVWRDDAAIAAEWSDKTLPALRAVVANLSATADGRRRARRIGANGQRLALSLDADAMACYWTAVLVKYVALLARLQEAAALQSAS